MRVLTRYYIEDYRYLEAALRVRSRGYYGYEINMVKQYSDLSTWEDTLTLIVL